MKRSLIITIGIVIILLIFSMWVYLFLYGAPKATTDVFTNLGVLPKGDKSVRIVDANTSALKDSQLALGGSALQQLTTRAVAGFGFASSSPDTLKYVERGTGHVYEINVTSGKEEQVSVTTFPHASEAVFSPDTTSVALTSYEGYRKNVSVGTILKNTTSIELIKLPLGTENIAFVNETTLYFTHTEAGKTIGSMFNIHTQAQSILFTINLTDVEVLWGNGLKAIYVLPKPSHGLESALYVVNKGALTPVTSSEFGLTAFTNDTYTIASNIRNNTYSTQSLKNSITAQQGILMLKEKCVFDRTEDGVVWCASPLAPAKPTYIEDWYKGITTSEDYLWHTDLSSESSELKGDIPKLSGKTLDVTGMTINNNGKVLLFENKIDQSLWIYRTGK